MANLQRYDNEGIELIIDLETGESFATARGYSRMSGVEYDTVKKRCQRRGLEKAEIPTTSGNQWGTVIPEDLIADWLIEDNLLENRGLFFSTKNLTLNNLIVRM